MLQKKHKHIWIVRNQRKIHLLHDTMTRNMFKTNYVAAANHFLDEFKKRPNLNCLLYKISEKIHLALVIRDKKQYWIHFGNSQFIQRRNVDICLKMGHIIPDRDGPQQPTNAADTSLYIQRLFIGADCAASRAQGQQTRREKQPTGKLCRLPSVWECVHLWINSCSVFEQNVLLRLLVRLWCPSVHLETQQETSLPTLSSACGANL